MAESVVSPTPVFMGEIGRQWPSAVNPAVTGIATDSHLALVLAITELRGGQAAAAASLADFKVNVADRFAATERRALEATIAAMRTANSDGLLKAIASKVGASA